MRHRWTGLLMALLVTPLQALSVEILAGLASSGPQAMAQSPTVMAEFRQKLAEYTEARAEFEQEARGYWSAISDKRRDRNAKRRDHQSIALDDYVLTQPPLYSGPKRPVDPSPKEADDTPRERKYIPVVADLLKAAAEHFQFVPQRPANEMEFKRAYARAAVAEGLTQAQAVRVYAFETGGNGSHDLQSGLSASRPNARAISTAMGYNQLLTTNTVELVAEQGPHFIRLLTERAKQLAGQPRKTLEHKIAALRRMTAFCQTVPDAWAAHEKLANTPQGWGVHALVLDVDIGPLLQTHKLLTSVIFAQKKGYMQPLTGAELEMMNLTGDGTGFDMVTMPQALREQVPTANFFQRSGYERNPVAIRNNTVARLLAVTDSRMNSASNLPGARDLATAF